MNGRMTFRLLGAAGVVAAAAVLLWVFGNKSWDAPAPVRLDSSLFELPAPTGAKELGAEVREVAERPLFEPSRRPPTIVQTAGQEPDPIDKVLIHGLFGTGANGGAIVTVDGAARRVRFGEKLGPWKLQSVDGLRLNLINDAGEKRQLTMRHLPQAETAPSAPAGKPAATVDAAPPSGQAVPVDSEADSTTPAKVVDGPSAATDQPGPAAPPEAASAPTPSPPDSDGKAVAKPSQSMPVVTADESGKKQTRFRY